ncbi:MAG: hypothetical protein KKB51_10970 [Candidatus Riflebacteria bacterium]|nr:hypothetical protein [Candidatus Riflebacteria bacterium]
MDTRKALSVVLAFFFATVLMTSVGFAQIIDADGLLVDIPEPPGARSELPSPIPMVYEFMGAMMDGEYDICLANFDVQTFLDLLFDRQLKRMSPEDYRELFSYQIQTHRNEFRFLSKIMNRVAKGAKISYSDPRYHKAVQSKIVVKLETTRGNFEFVVYCRFINEKWFLYDYVLNGQRLTSIFRDALKGVGVDNYAAFLRPFYGERHGFRPIRNRDYDFGFMVPSDFQIKENVSPALLASVGAFEGQFLLHAQAATYDEPQNLAQVGKAIKDSLMPFSPRLFDQWKSELAGVEIGNILFHFMKNDRRLYTHMVIIPLGRKLVVLNFYHGSLELLKHMTNIRERIMETLTLPKIEAIGGIMPGEIPDELTISAASDFGEIDSYQEPAFEGGDEITISPSAPSDPGWTTTTSSEIPPPDEADTDMLQPDSFGNDDYPEPPPPPSDFLDDNGDSDDIPPPPPPPGGSYGDGSGTGDDDDYSGGDSEVSF